MPLAFRQRLLGEHTNERVRNRAGLLFGSSALSPRKSVIDAYSAALQLTGDAERGQKVFERECMTCHQVDGRGHQVGPNLATVQNRTPAGLLIQILDPNRELAANYMQYVVLCDDGRIVTGLIANESPTSITIKRAENVQETILRQNIEGITGTGKSLMPEGLEQKVSEAEMGDLLAYLLRLRN